MKKRSFLQYAAASASLCLPWAQAKAQAAPFPARPIRVIVPFLAGNVLDNAMRNVGEEFLKNTGQPLVIDNRAGGAGIIAAQAVMQAPADGYTLLLATNSMFGINPHTFSKLPYKPDTDFKPVTNVIGMTMVLAVRSDIPASTLAEFIAWVKGRPGKTSFASFTAGNSSHFMGIILNQQAGLDMEHIPFNGTPAVVQNLLGGQIDAAFLPLNAVKPMVDAGRVKVLAVSSPQRSPLLPQVVTFREAGFPALEIYIWAGLAAPAHTPDPIIASLNAAFVKILQMPELRDKWKASDMSPIPSTPEAFRQFAREDSKRWGEAVRISGFKANES